MNAIVGVVKSVDSKAQNPDPVSMSAQLKRVGEFWEIPKINN